MVCREETRDKIQVLWQGNVANLVKKFAPATKKLNVCNTKSGNFAR